MSKIKKVNRDDDIRKSSRIDNDQDIAVKRLKRRNKHQNTVVNHKGESSTAKALFNAPMAAARKASVSSIRKTEELAKRRDESSIQEETDLIANSAIEAVKEVNAEIVHGVPQAATKAYRRISKKTPEIRNGKYIRRNTKSMKRADIAVRPASKTTVEAQKASYEAGKQLAMTSERMVRVKKTKEMARKSVQWVKRIVKGIIEGIRSMCTALAAASAPVILVLIIAAAIAGIVSSAFGIFFTEQAGNETSLRDVILAINQDFSDQIAEVTASAEYDDLDIRGARASWADILAIYAVDVTTNSTNAQDAATVTDEKIARLQEIFTDMNTFTSYTEEVTETEQVQDVDEDGNPLTDDDGNLVMVDQEVVRTVLHIDITSITAMAEAVNLGFTEDQIAQVNALLATSTRTLWTQLLLGIGGGSQDLVNVALSQLGNEGGETYWRWAGLQSRCEWCALFVSWCADQTGLLAAGQVPYFSFCSDGVAWYQAKGAWIDGDDVNASNCEDVLYPGMIIFFDWADRAGRRDGVSDHVGIVTGVSGGTVYTVEGNSGDAVRENSYSADSSSVLGFGIVVS